MIQSFSVLILSVATYLPNKVIKSTVYVSVMATGHLASEVEPFPGTRHNTFCTKYT
jgi:hypothetical protein